VGTLTSAAHGHTLGRPVAMGYVRCAPGEPGETLVGARYEIELGGTVTAAASLRAWHDPTGARLRA
jgi:4-methylaminobutanoate oxidase (formaldehyde-forming)